MESGDVAVHGSFKPGEDTKNAILSNLVNTNMQITFLALNSILRHTHADHTFNAYYEVPGRS